MTPRALLVCLVSSPAYADSEPTLPIEPTSHASPDRLNFRLGGATTDANGRMTLCLDVRVWWRFSVEGCGTGSEVIHNEAGREMAHFRANWSMLQRNTHNGFFRLRGGLGFAELQVGVDRAGFQFNEPDAERGSVAGPEASVQGQWLFPLGAGLEAIGSATIGVAAFAHADKLVTPQSNVQPFASFEVGVGW